MATNVIKTNESIVPFLGDRINFIQGLDPLSLQTTSDATVSRVLAGLSSLTNRIRYYSFYCWLLDQYSKKIGSTDPKAQQRFVRRAEYLIALCSHYYVGQDNRGIAGMTYAWGEIGIKNQSVHNLQSGTYKENGRTENTYWAYPFGILGQYYLGSMRDMGIVLERENAEKVYMRTPKREDGIISGEELAAAFDQNVAEDAKELFLAYLTEKEDVTEADLRLFASSFDLTAVPKDSEEHRLLLALLLQKDLPLLIEEVPNTFRKQTIHHLLAFIAESEGTFSDRNFVYKCYNQKGFSQNVADECMMAWYYYQVNEFWHFANTSIFNGTLADLAAISEVNWQPLPTFVTNLTEKVIAHLIEFDWISSAEDSLLELMERMPRESSIYDHYKEVESNEKSEKVAKAFLLLFELYRSNQNEFAHLKLFGQEQGFTKEGEGLAYFLKEFEAKKEMRVGKFVQEYLYAHIIYRHQYVAFRKMGLGTQSSQKFMIEDQYIRYLGNFGAGYTGTRMFNLWAFLRDLDIVSAENVLTTRGEALLNVV